MKFETYLLQTIDRTPNVKSFRFPRPIELNYLPGQYFFIKIKNKEKTLKKHFSFSSSPSEKKYIEFTKKLSESEFSYTLKKLAKNSWIEIEAPYGNFTFSGEHDKIALLAGGIGITPFRSICKFCTDKQLPTRITLIYGNQTAKDIAFKRELEEMSKQNINLKIVLTVNEGNKNWKGLTSFINLEMIKKEIPDYNERIFYLCGPPGMVKVLKRTISELGVSDKKIKVEYFPGYQ
jgi:ferredoxin-NADP reductase